VHTVGSAVLTRKINKTQRFATPGLPVVEVRVMGLGGTIRVTSPRRSRWLGGRRRGGMLP
jgi:hypothetical protein